MGQWKITAVHTQAAEKIYIRGEKRMGKEKITDQAMYDFYGKMPLKRAIPLGLQHVLAMFVGNLTPLLIICGACGISGSEEFAHLQVCLLQNAMFVAGVVTLVQLYAIGPIGGKVPIIMGTSSGFIGVFKSVADTMGGGLATYGAIMGASILGGLFESVLGFFIKPLRKFFPAVVTGTVVLSIGLSLISVGINSFGGGSGAKDFGSMENLLLAIFVLVVILTVKHWTNGMASNSAILIGIIAGYIAAFVMSLVLPTTGITADGAEYTKAWVLNWDKVAQASWISIPEFLPVKPVFDARAIAPILIMFIVTAVETVGDISGVVEGGMDREATDKELSGGVICDGLGSSIAALFGVLPNTSFSQNVGLVAMTKVVNRFTIAIGAVIMILAGIFPIFGALLATLPDAVLGGCTIMMFGTIVVSGLQMISKCGFTQRNMIIAALSLSIGLGFTECADLFAIFPRMVQNVFAQNCVAVVFLVSILLNLVLPKNMEAEKVTEQKKEKA